MGSRWPIPEDSPGMRRTKIAWAYRAALEEVAPEKAAELDARFISWDESWVCPTRSFHPGDWVTADEAGSIRGVTGGAISSARLNGRIKGKRDGKRYLYLVEDVQALDMPRARRDATTKDTVTANGRSVSDEPT